MYSYDFHLTIEVLGPIRRLSPEVVRVVLFVLCFGLFGWKDMLEFFKTHSKSYGIYGRGEMLCVFFGASTSSPFKGFPLLMVS